MMCPLMLTWVAAEDALGHSFGSVASRPTAKREETAELFCVVPIASDSSVGWLSAQGGKQRGEPHESALGNPSFAVW